ncbi:hypothetical protein GF359_05315 [candidate division WOR-3 bacterium]|uniref:Uncharacterized protein n=1 Tax=candidate division WOR-3 bacterium TaxID=2052148 RepID=A0A9D5KAL2_UNCW3|nr:hypothetical protein [candidate division WOR-3 bacterium]MBD3364615.1 hypothetical protein [candidate division WOR-3 bacterium]
MKRLAVLGLCVLLVSPVMGKKKDKKKPEEIQVTELENLSWKPFWTTHIACIKGCLDYLEMDVSDAWLYGGTGHAFVINIHEQLCPSGPTAWVTSKTFELGENVGYRIEGVMAWSTDSNFADVQSQAWDMVRAAIDEGYPCYGWELNIPEFYVITGYDEEGYYYSGPIRQGYKMPLPWEDLGKLEVQMIEMYAVKPGEPLDDRTTVAEALQFALEIAESPEEWTFEGYASGPEAYDLWIAALQDDTLFNNPECVHGFKYNTQVWSECRAYAVEFLKQAKERLADEELDPLFEEAISRYDKVARSLYRVTELYPWYTGKPSFYTDKERIGKAIAALEVARDAESMGLEALQKIVDAI